MFKCTFMYAWCWAFSVVIFMYRQMIIAFCLAYAQHSWNSTSWICWWGPAQCEQAVHVVFCLQNISLCSLVARHFIFWVLFQSVTSYPALWVDTCYIHVGDAPPLHLNCLEWQVRSYSLLVWPTSLFQPRALMCLTIDCHQKPATIATAHCVMLPGTTDTVQVSILNHSLLRGNNPKTYNCLYTNTHAHALMKFVIVAVM